MYIYTYVFSGVDSHPVLALLHVTGQLQRVFQKHARCTKKHNVKWRQGGSLQSHTIAKQPWLRTLAQDGRSTLSGADQAHL